MHMPCDYTNEKLDIFVEQLQKEHVNYIDLRESMHEDGINQYDLFYRTDHHWNVRGGMYAASKIIKSASNIFDEDIDYGVTDLNNYESEIYPQWHLGSRGQRVGRYFTGIDDFEIMIPKFETKIQRNTDGAVGTFKEIFINEDALQNKDYESRYTYDKTFDSMGYEYVNNYAPSDRKIQILSDSLGRVVVPYLSLAFEDISSVGYEQVIEKVEKEQSDMLIMLIHPMNVFKNEYFEFN